MRQSAETLPAVFQVACRGLYGLAGGSGVVQVCPATLDLVPVHLHPVDPLPGVVLPLLPQGLPK